jgi:hypothetical protein
MVTHSPSSLLLLVAFCSGCKPFNINLATEAPIKMDPITINVKMDVYQHSSDKTGDGKKHEDESKAARERIYNRQQQLQEIKNNRWVIETHRGDLQVREKPAGENGTWVEKTVATENEDRMILMRAKAQELNLDLHEIQAQFWKDNVRKSYPGEYIEIDDPARPKMYKVAQKEAQ